MKYIHCVAVTEVEKCLFAAVHRELEAQVSSVSVLLRRVIMNPGVTRPSATRQSIFVFYEALGMNVRAAVWVLVLRDYTQAAGPVRADRYSVYEAVLNSIPCRIVNGFP